MNFLLTCDPSNVNHILKLNFSNYPKGDAFNEIFNILGNGIFNTDGESWRFQRKLAQSLMNKHHFNTSIVSHSREKAEKVLPLLDQTAEQDVVIDLQDVMARFTFDTTCLLLLGEDPACLAPDFPVEPFMKAIDEAEHVLVLRHTVPVIWWKLKRLLKVGSEKKMSIAEKVIDCFIEDEISKKRGNCTTKSDDDGDDLLTMFMKSMSHADEWRGYFESDKYFLRDSLLTFLAAGKDTVAVALTWFFWLVTMNPQPESKIVEELSQHRVTGDVRELVYLPAALYESLWLFPSVPSNHKSVLKADILPTGHRVLPGMMVIVPIYAMGRMKAIWGEDCMEFKPERLITEEGRLRHEPSNKVLSFSCGPRTCLGKAMSFMQMKVVAAAVISRFRFQLVEGHVVKPKPSIVLTMKDGLMVKVVKRS